MNTFQNPILLHHADPDVLLFEDTYYLYATSHTRGDCYEVYASTDLVHWENRGVCLEKVHGLCRWYWAPDVKEKNGRFYMLYTADEHLGMAVADSPLGPFVPTGFLWEKSIDGHIFFDEDGRAYIYYVSWRKDHPYALWGCEMCDDLVTPRLETEVMIFRATEPYECHMAGVVEAPYMLKKDGRYYLTYSASHFRSPFYCVAYAVSDHPLKGYVKYRKNPILVGDNRTVNGIGHHCITTSPDGSRMFLLYHTHDDVVEYHTRHLSLSRIRFDMVDGETILVCEGHTFEPQPYPLE